MPGHDNDDLALADNSCLQFSYQMLEAYNHIFYISPIVLIFVQAT